MIYKLFVDRAPFNYEMNYLVLKKIIDPPFSTHTVICVKIYNLMSHLRANRDQTVVYISLIYSSESLIHLTKLLQA